MRAKSGASRHQVLHGADGITITLPVLKNPVRLTYLVFLLLGYGFASAELISNLMQPPTVRGSDTFVYLFIVFTMLFVISLGSAILAMCMWLLFGAERVSLSAGKLSISQVLPGWRRDKIFPTAQVRNLRAADAPEKLSLMNTIESIRPSRRIGSIAFDYGAWTYRFFNNIDRSEAREIVAILSEGLVGAQHRLNQTEKEEKFEKFHPPRNRVESLDGGTRIILPGRKRLSHIFWGLYIIAIGSLPAACIGFFIANAIAMISQPSENFTGPVLFWGGCLIPYISLTLFLGYRIIGPMFTTEIIEVDQYLIRYRTELLSLKREKQYELSAITNLRALPDPQFMTGNIKWRRRDPWPAGGRLTFDYDGLTIQIFNDIEEAEASLIADQIRPFLQEIH